MQATRPEVSREGYKLKETDHRGKTTARRRNTSIPPEFLVLGHVAKKKSLVFQMPQFIWVPSGKNKSWSRAEGRAEGRQQGINELGKLHDRPQIAGLPGMPLSPRPTKRQ